MHPVLDDMRHDTTEASFLKVARTIDQPARARTILKRRETDACAMAVKLNRTVVTESATPLPKGTAVQEVT